MRAAMTGTVMLIVTGCGAKADGPPAAAAYHGRVIGTVSGLLAREGGS